MGGVLQPGSGNKRQGKSSRQLNARATYRWSKKESQSVAERGNGKPCWKCPVGVLVLWTVREVAERVRCSTGIGRIALVDPETGVRKRWSKKPSRSVQTPRTRFIRPTLSPAESKGAVYSCLCSDLDLQKDCFWGLKVWATPESNRGFFGRWDPCETTTKRPDH